VYFDLDDADLVQFDDALLRVVAGHLVTLGVVESVDADRATIESALERWAGRENLEERLRTDGQIDSVVLGMLAAAASHRS
jgi:hypothetical protein